MDLGPAGRGGARRRTRRRTAAVAGVAASKQSQSNQTKQPTSSGPTDILGMLKVLHEQGILTDEEYQAKKMLVVEKM